MAISSLPTINANATYDRKANLDLAKTPDAPMSLVAETAAQPIPDELQKTFQDFVGQTFFGQMIASMRSGQNEAPYFNGGRAEKIFQGQLDQVLAEEMSDASASQFSDPMFKLFQLHRQA